MLSPLAPTILVLAALGAETPTAELTVDFGQHLRPWDGFGVNYVETHHIRDPHKLPQDYSGFSLLDESQRQEILGMIFGPDGLKPGVVKMFLDPFHEGMSEKDNDNADPNVIDLSRFDHQTTTRWMRYFAHEGLAKTRARGGDLTIFAGLYGPSAWMTRQKFVRGRDLDPAMKEELAEYIISWAKYLRDVEKLPVKYVSLHNEGEARLRWPKDGSTAGEEKHDYNMYWPPEQVAEMVKLVRRMLDRQGMRDVAVTPGETSTWLLFDRLGYARAVAADPDALAALGLITSHGFLGKPGGGYGDHRSTGNDLLRAGRPDLHSWTTSMTWGKMDVHFLDDVRGQIYDAKVNAVIPWACIQTMEWISGPNSGTAFRVEGKEKYSVQPGYWWYKQISTAGQPGMAVAEVQSSSDDIGLIAFAQGDSSDKDAFVVINRSGDARKCAIRMSGGKGSAFHATRTSDTEHYQSIGRLLLTAGELLYTAPARSATTFCAE